ncbi:MAG TPA: MauE/DoxX family redox-associated membrane protein [Pyrinomonadaceae bacterium]|nr:MauE/DoxX family redox-associated membrane protein [Pyrinomonadaceae bacterium]
MDIVLLILRIVLFGIFALAVLGKLLDLEGAEKAVKDFGIPEPLAKPVSWLLIATEGVIGLMFVFNSMSWYAAVSALALLTVFIVGMIVQIQKGKASECHCFGQIHSEPVSRKSLVRNMVFALMALVLSVQGRSSQGMNIVSTDSTAVQTVTLLFLAVAAIAIVIYLKKIFTQQTQIMRRLEIIELISNEDRSVERADAGDPHDGLPIGSPFPAFTLENAFGNVVTLNDLREKGKGVLFLFVSPTCEPCKALLPQIEAWRTELGDKLSLAFLSSGSAKDNLEKFGDELGGDILIQSKREIAEAVRAKWTPTALFVRADGTIGSHAFVGDQAIGELMDNIRHADLSDRDVYFTNSNVQTTEAKIGESAPDFELESTGGESISRNSFQNKTTLAVFWSPTCPHCHAMIDELRDWDLTKNGSDPELIVFSDGSREEHENLGLRSPIVTDQDFKISESLGMFGTPSAVLIDETGTIVSEAAVGSVNIWALLGKRK